MNGSGQQGASFTEAPVVFHRDELGVPSRRDRLLNGVIYAFILIAVVVSLAFLFLVA